MPDSSAVDRLMQRPEISGAVDAIRGSDEQTVVTQIELSEIAAPPFAEEARAACLAEMFRIAGLEDVRSDEVGNVLALRPGRSDERLLVVSAHLDTVFPEGTDVSVEREGSLLRGPGIADDARGLAALVALVRGLDETKVATEGAILFVGTVGEEGAGDLRGVKHLFRDGGRACRAAGFVSLDGAGIDRIVSKGLGSRRYRVTVQGPGGHSWVDWGTPNPAHLLVEIGRALTTLELQRKPKTTLTIARMGGGKSINAIPQEVWMEIDTRSEASGALDDLETALRRAARSSNGAVDGLRVAVDVIGDRPGGESDADAPLVRAAVEATRALGTEPVLARSSTDANIPMSLGIPAITLGCGGEAGQAHTTDEWFRNVDGADGIVRALYTLLLAVGVPPP